MQMKALATLVGIVASCSSSSAPSGPEVPPRAGIHGKLVERENQLPGDPDWRLAGYQRGAIEGYGDAISLHPGDTLNVAVSTRAPRPVTWTVYRIGYYGGAGARKVGGGGPIDATTQPACPADPTTMRVECRWTPSFAVPIAADALSGVYLVKLHSKDGEVYVPFVVVDQRAADLVLDVNVTSWQAYNDYGGESLYGDASGTMPSGKAWEVSFDRPFSYNGAGRFLQWEVWFVQFVEALGYDVTYTTAFDIVAHPESLLTARAFVSVANDEYWFSEQRDAVESARDQGVNLAFFGADQALWRIRAQPSSSGQPGRVIACYKNDQDQDPVRAKEGDGAATSRFRDEPNPRPENALIGVMYEGWMMLPQPLIIKAPDHWAFAGTGLVAGDALPGMVSAEFDIRFANGVEPDGLKELAVSPVVSAQGWPDTAMMTFYTAPSGAEVIAAGSLGWPNGLGATPYASPAVARITRNVLDRFVGAGGEGGPDPDGAPWTRPGSEERYGGRWATQVSTFATGLTSPTGMAAAPDGAVFVADTWAHVVRRIGPNGSMSTYAGTGVEGFLDGPGESARFRFPIGLALAADGTLYVADSFNNVVRAVAPDAARTVSTVAGVKNLSGGFADGPATQARFSRPVDVAVAADGSLLVADMQNGRIRHVDAGSRMVTTYAGSAIGFADGPAALARLASPSGLAVADDGTVYFIDTSNHALRRVRPDAAHTVETVVGGLDQGVGVDGPVHEARISAHGGLAIAGGRVYFADTGNLRVRALDLMTMSVFTVAGSGRASLQNGDGSRAGFSTVAAVTRGADGSLLVADPGNGAVRRIRP